MLKIVILNSDPELWNGLVLFVAPNGLLDGFVAAKGFDPNPELVWPEPKDEDPNPDELFCFPNAVGVYTKSLK